MAGSVPPAVVKTSTRARRSYCFSLLQREHQGVRRVSEFYSSEVHPTFCFRCFHPPPPTHHSKYSSVRCRSCRSPRSLKAAPHCRRADKGTRKQGICDG